MVCQRPSGTLPIRRLPRSAQPRSGAILVRVQVSSINTRREGTVESQPSTILLGVSSWGYVVISGLILFKNALAADTSRKTNTLAQKTRYQNKQCRRPKLVLRQSRSILPIPPSSPVQIQRKSPPLKSQHQQSRVRPRRHRCPRQITSIRETSLRPGCAARFPYPYVRTPMRPDPRFAWAPSSFCGSQLRSRQ